MSLCMQCNVCMCLWKYLKYVRLTNTKIRAVVTSGREGNIWLLGSFNSSFTGLLFYESCMTKSNRARWYSKVNYVFSECLKYFIIKIVSTVKMSSRKLSLFSIHYYWYKNTNNKIILFFWPLLASICVEFSNRQCSSSNDLLFLCDYLFQVKKPTLKKLN